MFCSLVLVLASPLPQFLRAEWGPVAIGRSKYVYWLLMYFELSSLPWSGFQRPWQILGKNKPPFSVIHMGVGVGFKKEVECDLRLCSRFALATLPVCWCWRLMMSRLPRSSDKHLNACTLLSYFYLNVNQVSDSEAENSEAMLMGAAANTLQITCCEQLYLSNHLSALPCLRRYWLFKCSCLSAPAHACTIGSAVKESPYSLLRPGWGYSMLPGFTFFAFASGAKIHLVNIATVVLIVISE